MLRMIDISESDLRSPLVARFRERESRQGRNKNKFLGGSNFFPEERSNFHFHFIFSDDVNYRKQFSVRLLCDLCDLAVKCLKPKDPKPFWECSEGGDNFSMGSNV